MTKWDIPYAPKPAGESLHVQLHTIQATVTATPVGERYRITRDGMFMGYIHETKGKFRAYKQNSFTAIVPPGGSGIWWTLEAAATALWKSIY